MYIGMEDEKRRAVKEAVEVATAKLNDETLKKNENSVRLLLKEGISVEIIAKCVDLPEERIRELEKEIK